jgi:hypothetical protein
VHALSMVRRELEKRLEFMHAKTRSALWRGVEGVMQGGQLWLTALGRALSGKTTDKHRIKAADRLLGNGNLQRSVPEIYRVLAEYLLRGIARPCISIDWTGAGPIIC